MSKEQSPQWKIGFIKGVLESFKALNPESAVAVDRAIGYLDELSKRMEEQDQ